MSTFIIRIGLLLLTGISTCKEATNPPFRPDMTAVSMPKNDKLPYYRGEIMDPWWGDAKTLPADLRRLDNFSLVAESGSAVAKQSIADKYTVLGFFFSRCSGICPMVTANIKKLSAKIPNQHDLVFLSLSVDPENDSTEVLKNYKARFKVAQNNWLFLSGSKEIIYQLARKTFNADVVTKSRKGGATDFLHTENIYLLDKDSYLRGVYRTRGGMDLDRLVSDLEILRKNG